MKKLIKNTLIILLNTFIILVVIEVLLGFYYRSVDVSFLKNMAAERATSGAYEKKDEAVALEIQKELLTLEIEGTSFIHYKLSKFNGKHTNIDKKGHRKTKNFNNKKNIDMLKIFCFGSSTMFSVDARDEYTIPSEFSKLIDQSFPNINVEVTNLGCHGYTRNIENAQLQQQIIQENVPDIVIFYDGVNETYAAYNNNKAGTIASEVSFKDTFKKTTPFNLYVYLKNTLRLANTLKAKISKSKPYIISNAEQLAIDIAEHYTAQMEISEALAFHYNFKVFNFSQPIIYTKKQLTGFEKKVINQHQYYQPLHGDTYEVLAKRASAITDTHFADISHTFNNTEKTIYTDYCHTGEFGNLLIAKEMYR
ncbi:SGNH/GDSL hydrolase family protein [uncultured Kordia sp.]|uniref:SGNH/GDSL hydrolase family protein n=1 Tax=uncultured Kordia sp. TaxID=507699 RepID=UPI00262D1952|nr:SGNH/GDSL hydrolase family protein [uncultured Kordia sp.]